MKIKKFKKELSIAIIEDILNKSSYFSIELKKENFKRCQKKFSTTILVKAMSKKLKISDFLISSTLKFPIVLNVFNTLASIDDHLLNNIDKKKISVVFAKLNFVCIKFTNFFLIPKLKYLNTFNTLGKILSPTVLLLKLLSSSKK